MRQGLQPLLHAFFAAMLTLLLASCASMDRADEQPVKSANDDRQYRLLTLDNEMEVLLISDPGTPKAAAALDVMVGSGDNPPGRGGLAHFLEHMLFLGTDKYPNAAEYEEYITEHGGSRNAYTSLENTNYFFDVNAPYLPEALDRFAQFFIAPRFDAQYVDREKNAVEAEYQMGLTSDGRRALDVLQEVINKDHPYSQFTVGSLETLADRPGSSVRDDLLEFYDKHYSANAMRLVVLGAQSLDELQELVVPMFSQVPNKSFAHDDIEAPLFAQGSLPMFVQVEPQATLRQLQVSFPIADYRGLYKAKPGSYVSNLVGHEGEGSLLSSLKAEGLAEGVAAGVGLGWRGGSLFSVDVSLTEKGAAQYERVLQLIFAYLDMLRDKGPREWLYSEQSRLADIQFRFREKVNPMSYVSALATGMQYYAAEDVLRGPYLMTDYEQEVIQQLLTALVPKNAMVMLSDKGVTTNRVSEYYGVPYARSEIGVAEFSAWNKPEGGEQLHLPAANEFIAEDLSLVKVAPENSGNPVRVWQDGRQTIWFAQDDEFRVPKGTTYINFRSPEVGQSAAQNAKAVLYTALLKDQMNEFAYPARLAGLSFNFYKHAQGISLRINGYSDKQALLLQELLSVVAQPRFDQRRFDDIRSDMIRSLRNSSAKSPATQVMDDLRESLQYGEWGEAAVIEVLEGLNRAALEEYVNEFWRTATAEVMIYGNYQRDEVQQVADRVASVISSDPPPPLPEIEVLKLASGESLLYPVDIAHDDSVVAWYLQAAGDTWADKAATALSAQIMKSGFFQQLRTEQQLGYIVSAFAFPTMEVPGLVMLIQSPVADARAVAAAMDAYMSSVRPALDEAQFERHKAALLSEILQPFKNLGERAEFYWQSIARKQWDFDGREALAQAVEQLTLEQWEAYYQRVFLAQRHSLKVVAPGKWQQLPQGSYRQYDSAQSIKQDHATYSID
jgi:secreted Zn-dependent insulinase-like peptidase